MRERGSKRGPGSGAALFGFVALPAVMIVAQLTLVVAYALATEALKRAAGQRLRLTGAARAARRPAHAAVRRRRAGP